MKNILNIIDEGKCKYYRFTRYTCEILGVWSNRKARFLYTEIQMIFSNKKDFFARRKINRQKKILEIFIKDITIKDNGDIKVNCVLGRIEVQVDKTDKTKVYFSGGPFFILGDTKYINCSRWDFVE